MSLMTMIARVLVRRMRPDRASVLRSLNDARRALGVPELDCIPAGQPGRMGRCPVSRSLPGVVGVDGVAFAIPDQAVAASSVWHTTVLLSPTGVYIARLPETLRRFVQDFDLGAYPELIATDHEEGSSIDSIAEIIARRSAA